MASPTNSFRRFRPEALSRALATPPMMAFLPALMLGGYWLGGEATLLAFGMVLPALVTVAALWPTTSVGVRASRDGLTDLPLEGALIERLDRMLTETTNPGRSGACMMVALDDAVDLERRLGRTCMDEVLVFSAERIASGLRDADLLTRRPRASFGVAIGPVGRADLEMLMQIAGRLQAALNEPMEVDGIRVVVSASIGFCAQARCPATSGEAFFAASLRALDEAQAQGPGAIRAFSPEMRPVPVVQAGDADALEAAFERGEIEPWFQPQISTDTGAVTAVEALARWRHPQRGLVSPAEFLPEIERAGLCGRLRETMLRASCSALKDWDRAGLGIASVAVNFSGADLRDPQIADRVGWDLDRYDLSPSRLVVEVLEDVIADADDDVVTRNIRALHELGAAVDLDDFGTGHASIANIRRFRVGRIKIDRCFVTRVDVDRDQQDIVAAILTMADRLRLGTVAEGVETAGEHALLAQLGCDHVQGFGIGRPMPADALAGWLAGHQARLGTPAALPGDTIARHHRPGPGFSGKTA